MLSVQTICSLAVKAPFSQGKPPDAKRTLALLDPSHMCFAWCQFKPETTFQVPCIPVNPQDHESDTSEAQKPCLRSLAHLAWNVPREMRTSGSGSASTRPNWSTSATWLCGSQIRGWSQLPREPPLLQRDSATCVSTLNLPRAISRRIERR